ncbi:ragulator complex protein LAMTOR4 homolog [Coccinella septempunctata]|uniref:ragulator complex protein LAMTOR4 homolog n=1 Tax=Coccinella septempunctata TaxID=41139 RepID=UPI001D08103F|nr:ragulator complex protein LAMTOR4 homolog [Coccinella septempunctata]
MDRIPIPGQIGYLILNEDGAVLSSSGELENDERTATIIMDLLTLTPQIDPLGFAPEEGFKKLSITYKNHCYVVCLSNRKIHIIKKNLNSIDDSLSVNV